MTSNAGGELIADRDRLGFSGDEDDSDESYQDMKQRVIAEGRKTFRPEFLNRLDDIIVFHELNRDQVREIASLMIHELKARLLEEREITFELDRSAWNLLIEQGYDVKYGARPMRRTIERLIENPISESILEGAFSPGSVVTASAAGDEMRFTLGEG